MLKVSEAFCSVPKDERKGVCIGIVPTNENQPGLFTLKNGYPNIFVEVPIITPLPVSDPKRPDLINRNHVNILSSDAIIALPGGNGTANEIMLAQKFGKPIIIFESENAQNDSPDTIPRTRSIQEIENFLNGIN